MGRDPLGLVYDNCCCLIQFFDRHGCKVVYYFFLCAPLRKAGVPSRSCVSGSQVRDVSLGALQTWEREERTVELREYSVNNTKGRHLSQQTGQEEVKLYELSNPIINTSIKLFKSIKSGRQ